MTASNAALLQRSVDLESFWDSLPVCNSLVVTALLHLGSNSVVPMSFLQSLS